MGNRLQKRRKNLLYDKKNDYNKTLCKIDAKVVDNQTFFLLKKDDKLVIELKEEYLLILYNKKIVRNISYHDIKSWCIIEPDKIKFNTNYESFIVKTSQLKKIKKELRKTIWNMYYYIHSDNRIDKSL